MNPTEIFDALEVIAKSPFDPWEFPFSFAEATDTSKSTITKLRNGGYNKSKLDSGVLLSGRFFVLIVEPGTTAEGLERLRSQKATKTQKPKILLATDGEDISAEHIASGDTLHCKFTELHDHFGFFLPAAGISRFKAAEENEVDVKAAGKLAKLYDALLKRNPGWKALDRRHDLNQLMTRLIFCMFAEDVGIFPDGLFSKLVFRHSGNDGVEADLVISQAFGAMDLRKEARVGVGLPAWTEELPYVNGSLFAGSTDCPTFDRVSYRYLKDAFELDWRRINPDIFGSMIQSVADADKRSELGMHYTSVPNILKVIGPLFLDSLDADIEKAWDKPKALNKVLLRLSRIRVFDPACGSGNFLVVSYRELRDREMKIMKRLEELTGGAQIQMFSDILLSSFYGIEVTDFGAETAKLALFIAEYQANSRMAELFGRSAPALPLRDGGSITCGNALRLDWETVCPPPTGDVEVFIAGNPPFLGNTYQSKEQKTDVDLVFGKDIRSAKNLDYVACWFFKSTRYIRDRNARAAFVSTNSICQGQSVGILWPHVLKDGVEIGFAHKDFKWQNNAASNAAVMCVIVGLRNASSEAKKLIVDELASSASNINAYLADGPDIYVQKSKNPISNLPDMTYGNKPVDGGHLLMSQAEAADLTKLHPAAKEFIRTFVGSEEVINGTSRRCLWIDDDRLEDAVKIPEISSRLDKVRANRLESPKAATRKLADRPHQFDSHRSAKKYAYFIPSVSSEKREYLPVDRGDNNFITSNLNFALYDAPDWCFSLIASRLHLVWIATVCGRLESRFRYSNTMGWNTFPVPNFTDDQLKQLVASARNILKVRADHYPASIAELYDPKAMPEDLREAHKENDDLLETMYIGRPFKNDSERLEKLFKLYAARIEKMKKEAA